MSSMNADKIRGIVGTVVFHVLLLLVLLYFGLPYPYPPPAEQGILINFGDSPTGRGVKEPAAVQQQVPKPQVVPQPQPQTRIEQTPMTQDFEDAPAIEERRRGRKPRKEVKPKEEMPKVVEEQPKIEKKPREVNRSALFPGQRTAESQGQGNDMGSGNQGSLEGAENSPNTVGSLGDISGASLSGRSLEGRLPEPDYRVQESGKVIVRIKVSRSGVVTEAKAQQLGSTVINATLFEAAEKAAMRARFDASPNSPIFQTGTITYVFNLGE
jgi:TonB family protein